MRLVRQIMPSTDSPGFITDKKPPSEEAQSHHDAMGVDGKGSYLYGNREQIDTLKFAGQNFNLEEVAQFHLCDGIRLINPYPKR